MKKMEILMVCMQLIFTYLNFKTKFMKFRKEPYKATLMAGAGRTDGRNRRNPRAPSNDDGFRYSPIATIK